MTEPLCFDDLDDAALDQLPFGVVRLGPTGRVERYNRAEAERAGIQRWRALGRDFLRDLAGADARDLAARIDALPPGETTRVHHTFRGFSRVDDAVIEMARCQSDRIYLCIRSSRAA